MKLILEILPHNGDEQVVHRAIEKFPATVGRGFQNDVILTDPYVSPQHMRIDYDGENWIVSDLNSVNGITVNMVRKNGAGTPVMTGDTIRIGQTELRVYAPHHQVANTMLIQRSPTIFSWLARPLNVWACFILAVAIMQGWSFLEIWAEEPGMVLAASAAGTAGTIVVWAALWSVAGRLIRHRSHFMSHAAMMSLYIIAGAIAWYIEVYADFLANENWLAHAVTYGINFVLLAFLLYGSLALASRMARKKRLLSAMFFSIGVIAGILSVSIISTKSFTQQPLYPATLEPFLSQLAPVAALDKFMSSNEKLFASEEFKKSPAVSGP